jgi:hypothetical protein
VDGWEPKNLLFSKDAQNRFIQWRNKLELMRDDLPKRLHGFLPKAYGYAIRFAGALHCLDVFHKGEGPKTILSVDDIERGIKAVSFYLGHIIDAIQTLYEENIEASITIDEQIIHLAKTLNSLRGEKDGDKLSIGQVEKAFNATLPKEKHKSAKAISVLLKEAGLTVPNKRFSIHGVSGRYGVIWNEKIEKFLKKVHDLHNIHEVSNDGAFNPMKVDIQSPSSSYEKEGGYEFNEGHKITSMPGKADEHGNHESYEDYEVYKSHDRKRVRI